MIIEGVAGGGDHGPDLNNREPHIFNVICYPYSDRYGTLPPHKLKISKLLSTYLNMSPGQVNKMLEGNGDIDLPDSRYRLFHKLGKCFIVATLNDKRSAEVLVLNLVELSLKAEVIGITKQQHRDMVLDKLLKNEC